MTNPDVRLALAIGPRAGEADCHGCAEHCEDDDCAVNHGPCVDEAEGGTQCHGGGSPSPLIPDGWKLGPGWFAPAGWNHLTCSRCNHKALFASKMAGGPDACAAHAADMGALVRAEPPAEQPLAWTWMGASYTHPCSKCRIICNGLWRSPGQPCTYECQWCREQVPPAEQPIVTGIVVSESSPPPPAMFITSASTAARMTAEQPTRLLRYVPDWNAPVDHGGKPKVVLERQVESAGGGLAFFCRLIDGRIISVDVDTDGCVGSMLEGPDGKRFGGIEWPEEPTPAVPENDAPIITSAENYNQGAKSLPAPAEPAKETLSERIRRWPEGFNNWRNEIADIVDTLEAKLATAEHDRARYLKHANEGWCLVNQQTRQWKGAEQAAATANAALVEYKAKLATAERERDEARGAACEALAKLVTADAERGAALAELARQQTAHEVMRRRQADAMEKCMAAAVERDEAREKLSAADARVADAVRWCADWIAAWGSGAELSGERAVLARAAEGMRRAARAILLGGGE